MPREESARVNRPRPKKHHFTDAAGNPLPTKHIHKFYRDVLIYHHGVVPSSDEQVITTPLDIAAPLAPIGLLDLTDRDFLLKPGPVSPVCQKCKLNELGAKHPYFEPDGPAEPLITVVLDAVSSKEDARGELASDGTAAFLAKLIDDMAKDTGVTSAQVRWSPATRCSPRAGPFPNMKSKGTWCRLHLVQDLMLHPPKLVMPIGSVALGLLSHKSNAQDWGGRLLTWRGWPDDWLTDPKFMLPPEPPKRKQGEGDEPYVAAIGHPLFGPYRGGRIPMMPLQSPKIIYGTQNPQLILRWKKQLKKALMLATTGAPALDYHRPWYRITEDPEEVLASLCWLCNNPGTLVSYDTETNGLRPWLAGAAIVFMMFRWRDKAGEARAIGFPWDYGPTPDQPGGSPMRPHIARLTPFVLKALEVSEVAGHNVAFDALFSMANLVGADVNRLANSFRWDTWHMCYTMRQQRGTLALESLPYDYVPGLAGYEEDMTLLIDLHHETMHPDEGQHAHYAACPKPLWKSHLEPYVMGDVEAVYTSREVVWEKLQKLKTYRMPLAHPTRRGHFRLFEPQSRANVYRQIISPANCMLIKLMARGLHVDVTELAALEDLFPKQLLEMRAKLKGLNVDVVNWCDQQEATVKDWVFDLESKTVLQDLLFKVLKFPVEKLTEAGVKLYGEELDGSIPEDQLLKYAKVDKYTLNKMAVRYPDLRPLLDYRRLFKAYTSYIRPIRNSFFEAFDKKQRDKDQHLARDGRVHAQFFLTGTRSGRLSSANPNLQQLPRESLVKRIYRSRFGDHGYLYQGDLSQIELRLIAAACGDKAMVDAYIKGIDLHSLSMSLIFKMPYEHCTKDYVMWLQGQGRDKEAKEMELRRKISKTLNFLTGYGGGAYGFQATLANDSIYFQIEECDKFLGAFFDSYPSLKEFLSYYKRFIADSGVAVSITGRVRVFEDVESTNQEYVNKALRAGCNHLIQATASDMMLICMCTIEGMMREEGLESILVSTVHDSLVADVVREELPQVHNIVTTVFNNVPEVMRLWFGPEADLSWMILPFGGDSEVGRNYLDTQKLSPDDKNDWDKICHRLSDRE
jgi:DNA polymerase I-like protein with 3'-5' exonuclease and polymerase domains/uracil-DNA glycosylase